MIRARVTVRRPIAVALACSAMLLIGVGQGSAQADVTAVKGSAYGYSCMVSAFGLPCRPAGPTPTVTLASNASNSPQTAAAASARADSGFATIFSSGRIDVSTQGTLGPTGSVTSSTNIANVNASGQENFTASNLASTCTASETGVSGSTTITGGTLQIDNGDSDPTNSIPDHPPVEVVLPASPAPNTTYNGHVHIGNTTDNFQWVFNEQVVNPDGSLTLNAAHQYLLGPAATGNLILGQVVCGVTAVVDTTAPQTTIDSGPSGTIATGSASFSFSSTEAGSSFECKLDGPGAVTGSFGSCTSPKSYSNLADGVYTFSVRATDAANNTDATPATRSFTVNTVPVDDRTPPAFTLSARGSQKLGRSVYMRVSCPIEACRATARGTVRVPRIGRAPAKRYSLKAATAAIPKGGKTTLRPKLFRAAHRASRRALRAGRRVYVKLRVTVADQAGNKTSRQRRVRLRL